MQSNSNRLEYDCQQLSDEKIYRIRDYILWAKWKGILEIELNLDIHVHMRYHIIDDKNIACLWRGPYEKGMI